MTIDEIYEKVNEFLVEDLEIEEMLTLWFWSKNSSTSR